MSHGKSGVDTPEYIAANYGHCRLDEGDVASPNCECIKPGRPWRGTACENWVPTGATTLAEIHAHNNAKREANG